MRACGKGILTLEFELMQVDASIIVSQRHMAKLLLLIPDVLTLQTMVPSRTAQQHPDARLQGLMNASATSTEKIIWILGQSN